MRKIIPPGVDDKSLLERLAVSEGARARSIVGYMPDIADRYKKYEKSGGDPWSVQSTDHFMDVKAILHGLYEQPTVSLAFIDRLRSGFSGACPVCGRDALGTLDHYLPKDEYPEFSFFSWNLVPACDRCNNNKGVKFKGVCAGERALQPYFDGLASRRIITIKFRPTWKAPKLEPIAYGVRGAKRAMVQWHIDNIIKPAGISKYVIDMWGAVVENPRTFLGARRDLNDMRAKLIEHEAADVAVSKSMNSWRAAFFHGLRNCSPALNFLKASL